jgi:hypothetical protein
MNSKQFDHFWATNFPESPPINHLFKIHLKERWLRIHSLPEAKRYADSPEEWAILLERQNTVLADLFDNQESVIVYALTGVYSNEDNYFEEKYIVENECLKSLIFKPLTPIDLHKTSGDWYDEGVVFTPYFAKEKFKINKFDEILKTIANDEIRVCFVDTKGEFIFAPYDGGVDLVFKDVETRNFYEKKYEAWLPLV